MSSTKTFDWNAIDEQIWWIIGVSAVVVFGCCCLLVAYVETCHQSARKYETIEMMERRAAHIERGDHDDWDI